MARRSLSSSALSLASSRSSRTWGIRFFWEGHCVGGWSEVRSERLVWAGLEGGDQERFPCLQACFKGSVGRCHVLSVTSPQLRTPGGQECLSLSWPF